MKLLRRWLPLFVPALCEFEALPRCRELLVTSRLGQLARPFVERPGRGQLAGRILLVVLHFHGIRFRVGGGCRRRSAELCWAAAGPGDLLGALRLRRWVLRAVPPALETSGPAGEVIIALRAMWAVPIPGRVSPLPLSLALAAPFGPGNPELPVEVCQETLDVTQGCLGSHSPGDPKKLCA